MRFIHSVWSRPALMGRWNVEAQLAKDLWSFALSAHYIKSHGHELVLHTDEAGEQIFSVLPYDEVFRTLDDLPAADVFWAAGKAEAMRIEGLASAHVDGDVFIKAPDIFDLIASEDCDLVVQGDYYSEFTAQVLNLLRPYLVRYLPLLFGRQNHSYSCGVLKFNNQALKDEYIGGYRKITNYLSRSKSLISMLQQDRNIAVDLVVEQKLLRVLAETGGCNVRKVVSDPAAETTRHVVVEGYEHAAFISKYQQLPQIERSLREANPELHAKVAEHAEHLARLPPPSHFHAARTPGDGKGASTGHLRAAATLSDRMTRYAIVTPYCREERWQIERCVESVKQQSVHVEHFVVADGFAQEWLDGAGVRHIKLDRNHADCGNTPRGIGALLAVAEEYTAIGMLDVDNWLEPDHVEACLEAAATTGKPCDYVIGRRVFHRPDGELLEALREEAYHVDTSCFFFLRGSFCVLPHWAMMPPQMAGVCDRVFYQMIRQRDFIVARVPKPTIHFTTLYIHHYNQIGETPPLEVKHIDIDEADRWLQTLAPYQNEIARRLAGYPSRSGGVRPVERIPALSATIPSTIWDE